MSTSKNPPNIFVRAYRQEDYPFLRDMLVAAAYWREEIPPIAYRQMLSDRPRLAAYVEHWGREGDAAVVATVEDALVGVAWYRFFTEEEPGYGFLEPSIPEVGIAVVPSSRRQGVGRALLKALFAKARQDGVSELCLSVSNENPARKLYESFGFVDVADEGDHATMRARITA